MAIHNTRYGAHYWNRDEVDTYESSPNDLYRYTAFIGNQKLPAIPRGGSHLMVGGSRRSVHWTAETRDQDSEHLAVYISGYQCGEKRVSCFHLNA